MDRLDREVSPYRDRQSRAAVFPALAHSGRPYTPTAEPTLWEWSRVAAHRSAWAVVRRVDQRGQVSLSNRGHYVGQIHQGKDVYVMFDPDLNEWVFADRDGRQLRRRPADQINPLVQPGVIVPTIMP
jgi:hypothetical protein